MKKKTVITLLFVLPILVNCQNIENTQTDNLKIDSVSFDQNKQPDIRGVQIISCPSCARQGFDVIKTVGILEKKLEHIKTPISLSIIGCVVNGPGEALMTDIGFTGGGAGSGMIYTLGKTDHKIDNDKMIDHIVSLVEERAKDLSERQ